MNRPRSVQVTHTVTVTEGYDEIAKTSLSESVVLSATEPVFDPALSLIEQMGREASNKTTAQVTAYEHLAKAQSGGSGPEKPAGGPDDIPF
jgi:hypothetical protein